MTLMGGVMGWFSESDFDGLGSNFDGPLGTAKASHISKFVEFYKSVSTSILKFIFFKYSLEYWRMDR